MSNQTNASAATVPHRLREATRVAGQGLIAREGLVELIMLGAVAREHLLVVGPPGTGKSEAARRTARALGGMYFEYLLGRFTEPSELFGPIDLRRLREGELITETTGMLPEAEIAFLDEVFLGSTAILNTLLSVLAERKFRRGQTEMVCPLRICVGASNALPDDPALAAFADRFLLRVFVDRLPDPRLEELLEGGWGLGREIASEVASLDDVDALATAARQMDLSAVRPALAEAIRLLRGAGIELSDRRAVKSQTLVAAAAALAGRSAPTEADLWPLVSVVPTAQEQDRAREVLHDLLSATENAALVVASVEASAGRMARVPGLIEAGTQLLGASERTEGWRLKVEGVLREIDASFDAASLPDALATTRSELAAGLAAS